MNEVNELIKNLEIRELTIEQFLKELELNPIKIKQKEKTSIINKNSFHNNNILNLLERN